MRIYIFTKTGGVHVSLKTAVRGCKSTISGNILTMLRDKQDVFSRAISSTLSDIIFPSVFTSQSVSISRVSEI